MKILKKKNDDSFIAMEYDTKINEEWHHMMGEENKKLLADLEACRQELKNNYVQGTL